MKGDLDSPIWPRFERIGWRCRFCEAFTILELLVAIAVLGLMLALLLQVANHTLQASRVTTQQLDSTQSARRVIDAFSSDIVNAVTASGATILVQSQGGAPSLAFLTTGRGPGSAPTRYLAVNYQLKNNQIVRAYHPVGWLSSNLLAAAEEAATSPTDSPVLAVGILQFAVLAILEDGKTIVNLQNESVVSSTAAPLVWGASGAIPYQGEVVPAGWTALVPATPPTTPAAPRVRALIISIAAIDEQNFKLLDPSQISRFAQPATADPVKEWESTLNATSFPGPARASIRFLSKVVPLP